MSYPQTPWQAYQETPRVTFRLVLIRGGLAVIGGPNDTKFPTCKLLVDSSSITITRGADLRRSLRPFRLNLTPRKGRHFRVDLHPFAIPHLVLTQQVPRAPLLYMVAGKQSQDTSEVTLKGVRHCALAAMLDADVIDVHFATDYDLAVRQPD